VRSGNGAPLRQRGGYSYAWIACALLLFGPGAAGAADALTVTYRIDAGGISAPLGGLSGDAARGRALVAARDAANCVLCHAVPVDVAARSGDLGPSLAGVGSRWTIPQLRLRVVDSSRLNGDSIMPPYYRVAGLADVAAKYRDKPILSAQQVEDVVAWLATLR
jgi:sulfur-oxidizing protein SoxX